MNASVFLSGSLGEFETGLLGTLSRSNWNLEVLVFEERENRSTRRKTSQSKDENQQQTQPT